MKKGFISNPREMLVAISKLRIPWQFESLILYHYMMLTRKEKIKYLFNKINTIKKERKNDTVFILGSGYSINQYTDKQWQKIRKIGDTFSFNQFYRGNFIDIDYHIIRELLYYGIWNLKTYHYIFFYTESIKRNRRFNKTKFFVAFDKKTPSTDLILLRNILPEDRIILFSNHIDRRVCFPPAEINQNMPHCVATLFDAINLSYILGYKKLILLGVDLYDRRYFWLKYNESRVSDIKRGKTYKDIHETAKFVIKIIKKWKKFLNNKGIEIYVMNPKSLIAGLVPVFILED